MTLTPAGVRQPLQMPSPMARFVIPNCRGQSHRDNPFSEAGFPDPVVLVSDPCHNSIEFSLPQTMSAGNDHASSKCLLRLGRLVGISYSIAITLLSRSPYTRKKYKFCKGYSFRCLSIRRNRSRSMAMGYMNFQEPLSTIAPTSLANFKLASERGLITHLNGKGWLKTCLSFCKDTRGPEATTYRAKPS